MPRDQLNFRVSADERQAWLQAAERVGLDLSAWIRAACNGAANYTRVCEPGRHVGPVKRFDWGKVCLACSERVDR
jgi:hypothetical protein